MRLTLLWAAFALIVAAVASALVGLLLAAPRIELGAIFADREVWRILRVTLFQASLSTLLSLGLAIFFARALARRQHFWGRRWLIYLSSLTLVVPTMVAVLGIAVVHGRNGWVNQFLHTLGIEGYSLYGLTGILLAHIFFNLPLATRAYLGALQSIPQDTWRLANQLGLPPQSIFWHIEWPRLKSVIPSLAGLVFMLCFTSFAIVLTLGGGPKYATLEVAIYQALRFDFDIARGVVLAGIQVLVCLSLLALFHTQRSHFAVQLNTQPSPDSRPDTQHRFGIGFDVLVILLASAFLLSPLLAVLARAITPVFGQVVTSAAFLSALSGSLLIALSAGTIAVALALPIAFLSKHRAQQHRSPLLIDAGSSLILVVPPLTLGMGLFLLLRDVASLNTLGFYVVILINSLLAVPFVLRILQPAIDTQAQSLDRLSESLGVLGWARFRLLYFPTIRRALGFALALAVTLSLGDMGVIALFGTDELSTLPLYIYRQIGAYRMEHAAVAACLLCVLCALLFWRIERLIGGNAHA